MSKLYEEDFKAELQSHGISLRKEQCMQFQMYAAMLIEWNTRMNLTTITKYDEIYEKHFLDSILPSFNIAIKGSMCDVGAGAGFPSIPLKIIYPDLALTIVEPIGKRIRFLEALCDALHIHDITLVHARAEEYAIDHRAIFDIVSARAVANLTMLCELCIPLVRVGGRFIALKGANGDEEYKVARNAITVLGCVLEQRREAFVGEGAKRINFVFKKMRPTPTTYPRTFARIKKDPL